MKGFYKIYFCSLNCNASDMYLLGICVQYCKDARVHQTKLSKMDETSLSDFTSVRRSNHLHSCTSSLIPDTPSNPSGIKWPKANHIGKYQSPCEVILA